VRSAALMHTHKFTATHPRNRQQATLSARLPRLLPPQYAASGHSSCAGCHSPIRQGELRLGSPTGFGSGSYKWRCWWVLCWAVVGRRLLELLPGPFGKACLAGCAGPQLLPALSRSLALRVCIMPHFSLGLCPPVPRTQGVHHAQSAAKHPEEHRSVRRGGSAGAGEPAGRGE